MNGPSFVQTWVAFTRQSFRQVWSKLAHLFWKRFSEIVNAFIISLLGKGCEKKDHSFETKIILEFHLPKDALSQAWLNI